MKDFKYIPGEMEAWSKFLNSGGEHIEFSFQCSNGHTIDSPIDLNQDQVDQRCMLCGERKP
jgi:hypothetical protein